MALKIYEYAVINCIICKTPFFCDRSFLYQIAFVSANDFIRLKHSHFRRAIEKFRRSNIVLDVLNDNILNTASLKISLQLSLYLCLFLPAPISEDRGV